MVSSVPPLTSASGGWMDVTEYSRRVTINGWLARLLRMYARRSVRSTVRLCTTSCVLPRVRRRMMPNGSKVVALTLKTTLGWPTGWVTRRTDCVDASLTMCVTRVPAEAPSSTLLPRTTSLRSSAGSVPAIATDPDSGPGLVMLTLSITTPPRAASRATTNRGSMTVREPAAMHMLTGSWQSGICGSSRAYNRMTGPLRETAVTCQWVPEDPASSRTGGVQVPPVQIAWCRRTSIPRVSVDHVLEAVWAPEASYWVTASVPSANMRR
mmetsp:Transcript_3661/g.6448  ORF Transcript_3661/g.6448 Transcript_3661/m.6448 type:complete len:267 (-) Transcript_3661:1028-1828(-)